MTKKRYFLMSRYICFIFFITPAILKAEISIPPCENLKDFPLRKIGELIAHNEYDPVLNEYFGAPLVNWTADDFDIFVSAFLNCHDQSDHFFNAFGKSFFLTAVTDSADLLKKEFHLKVMKSLVQKKSNRLKKEVATLSKEAENLTISEAGLTRLHDIKNEAGDLFKRYEYKKDDFLSIQSEVDFALSWYKTALENKKRQEEIEREKAQRKAAILKKKRGEADEAQKLIKKHDKLGPPPDFLLSQFQTYAGSVASGDICTVIKLYDNLEGKKEWGQKNNLWILKRSDRKHEILYIFYDLRTKNGYVWLEKVIYDGQDYPSSELSYLIAMHIDN